MGIKSGNPEWKDYPDTSTPVTAQALNNIEDALDAGGGKYSSVVDATASVSITSSHLNSLIVHDSAVPGDIMVPDSSDNAFPIGGWVDFVCIGDGLLTVLAQGATQLLSPKTTVVRAKNAICSIVRIASDKWVLVGDLA